MNDRPRLHFTVPAGWINDPLGVTFHADRYHLFAQYLPDRVVWSPECRWSHATSTDLLEWTMQPVALEPGGGDGGVWSGSVAVPPDGPTRLFYTSVDAAHADVGRIRVARPVDDLWIEWVKGPVVALVPQGVDAVAFRDPHVVFDGSRWLMVVGGGLADGTAVAWLYTSDDLETWRFSGELARRHTGEEEPVWTGLAWECPQLIEVDGRWALVVSVWEPGQLHYIAYAVGDLVDGRFVPGPWRRLTFGPAYYAASAFRDEHGRPGLIHWLRGVDDPSGVWSGASSLPQLLRRVDDRILPLAHPSIASRRVDPVALEPGKQVRVESPTIDIEWTPVGTESALTIAADDGSSPLEMVVIDDTLTVTADAGEWSMPRTGPVRVVVDIGVVEIYCGSGALAMPARLVAPVTLTGSGWGTAYSLTGTIAASTAAPAPP